jgi:Ala-tRNA(Pro) deacylase
MNTEAFLAIQSLFDSKGAAYKTITHAVCRTSEESAKVRGAAGFPDAIGAKALLCKVDFRAGPEFVTFVLPGTHALDKAKLKARLPDLKQFRFATMDELRELAGVVPGCMPPFGKQICPASSRLYIAESLKEYPEVAFNAAKLDASIILASEDYFASVEADDVFDFSNEKGT